MEIPGTDSCNRLNQSQDHNAAGTNKTNSVALSPQTKYTDRVLLEWLSKFKKMQCLQQESNPETSI
jgi:hypothetical protein